LDQILLGGTVSLIFNKIISNMKIGKINFNS